MYAAFAGRTMDFSFDHSQIPIIGLKVLELPTAQEATASTSAAAAPVERNNSFPRSDKKGTADSTNSTLEKRLENVSLSPGASLSEHTLSAWRKSGSAQVESDKLNLFKP
jgi:hypothetical protein